MIKACALALALGLAATVATAYQKFEIKPNSVRTQNTRVFAKGGTMVVRWEGVVPINSDETYAVEIVNVSKQYVFSKNNNVQMTLPASINPGIYKVRVNAQKAGKHVNFAETEIQVK